MESLKSKAQRLQPTVQIGKKGLSEEQVAEIKLQLKTRKLVKIKLLRSFSEGKNKKKIFQDLAAMTKSALIYTTGFVGVLHKR